MNFYFRAHGFAQPAPGIPLGPLGSPGIPWGPLGSPGLSPGVPWDPLGPLQRRVDAADPWGPLAKVAVSRFWVPIRAPIGVGT